ncbi:GNAT family N-acetyltransferase [Nocardioides sp. HB32]
MTELRALAQACLDADGGLPLLTEEHILRARLHSGETREIRTPDGSLVAAAAVTVRGDGASTSGLVHPAHRGQGHGRELLGWALERAGGVPLTVTCENVNPSAERLYARFGLERFFAEQVMRHPLGSVPDVAAPEGVTLVPVADASRADLFAAYAASFSDRPGFPDPTEEEWLEELDGDPEWRRDVSAVALGEHGEPVGFVNVLGCWVDQVGVVPAWRGRGLGAHLVVRALAGLVGEAWLSVNLDNPAGDLYASLGFERYGVRGRWA